MLRLVAEMYYDRGLGLQQIADLSGYSVATVSRMRRQAIDQGIVRISILKDDDLEDLRERISAALGARVVVTVGQHADPRTESRLVGAAAATEVLPLLPRRGIVGWTSGHTIDALVQSLPRVSLPDLGSVPLIGGWDIQQAHLDTNGLVSRFARKTGGSAHFLNAPAVFGSVEAKQAMLAHPQIQPIVELWDQVDVVVMGCGTPPDETSNYFTVMDQADPDIRAELASEGVVGDVLSHLFTIDGRFVAEEWASRQVTVPLETVRKVPTVIAVLGGHAKVRSLIGLGRTGVVDVIVTDQHTATEALELLEGT